MAGGKGKKRAGSLAAGGSPSVHTILPSLQRGIDDSNNKLTARQMRVASIIRGERMSLGLPSQQNLPSMIMGDNSTV